MPKTVPNEANSASCMWHKKKLSVSSHERYTSAHD